MHKQWKIGMMMFFMVALLFGCSANKDKDPRMVANAFLQALQEHNTAVAQEYSLWKKEEIELYQITKEDYIDGIDNQIQEDVLNKVMQFTYEIKEIYEKDKNAVAVIELSMYDFTDALQQGMKEAEEMLKKTDDMKDKKKMQQQVMQILFEKMQENENRFNTSLKVNLIKQKDAWKVSDENDELKNTFTRNIEGILQYTNT